MDLKRREQLRRAVRFTYDLQRLRMSTKQRNKAEKVELEEVDKEWMDRTGTGLHDLEKGGFKHIKSLLKGIPIWEEWLTKQHGVGPAIAGFLISEIDIERAQTISALWRYCGLGVDTETGKAERLKKGEKAHFNRWLKSKVLFVLGGSFLKSKSPWAKFYYDNRNRLTSMNVQCAQCEGTGSISKAKAKKEAERADPQEQPDPTKRAEEVPATKAKGEVVCFNCEGKGRGPWGKSEAHRHQAALRYMCKQFLAELWVTWRTIEGLEVREPYKDEFLGKTHHESRTTGNTKDVERAAS